MESRIFLAVVTEIVLNDVGIPVAQAEDAQGGVFFPCFIAGSVAGADGRFSIPAVTVGGRVILLENPMQKGRSFFIIGGLTHPLDSMAISADGIRTAKDADTRGVVSDTAFEYFINQDYKLTHVSDYHVQNLNSYINMSDVNGLTLEGSPRVSVQIPDDEETAVFRVAAGGLALNTVLNAEPFMNRLFDYLGELKSKIDALERMIEIINPALINAMNSTGALLNAATPGSGAALIEQSVQVSNGATDLSASGTVREASDVRTDAENDKNSYILIP